MHDDAMPMPGEPPAYENLYEVGREVAVTGTLAVRNSSGGTTIVQHSRTTCRVTKAWWDYETGWRYHGEAVSPADAAEIRLQATSEFGPDWYRRERSEDAAGLAAAETALRDWNPEKVFFSEWDVEGRRG